MIKCDSKIKISKADTTKSALRLFWNVLRDRHNDSQWQMHLDLLKLALKYYKYLAKIL